MWSLFLGSKKWRVTVPPGFRATKFNYHGVGELAKQSKAGDHKARKFRATFMALVNPPHEIKESKLNDMDRTIIKMYPAVSDNASK